MASIEDIKARIRVVCICNGVKAGKIEDAIANGGCKTVAEVNKKCGTGSGGCGATRCKPVIELMLQNNGKIPKDSPENEPDANDLDF